MKCKIPEISWHNRDPVLSVDIQPKSSASPNIYRLASGGTDSHVLIWYMKLTSGDNGDIELDLAADLTRHQRAVNVVKWSPNGELLASGDDESVVFIWKQKSDSEPINILDPTNDQDKEVWITLKVLRGHMEDIYDLSWAPNSSFLVSGSVDNSAMVWDVQKGKSMAILSDHKGFVQGVAWDPKNQYIATLSTDRYLRIFDIQSKKVLHRISKGTLPVAEDNDLHGKRMHLFHDDTLQTFFRRLSFTPDGKLLLTPAGVTDYDGCTQPLNTTYVFSRYGFRQPAIVLPCPEQYTVAVCCSPLLYSLRPHNPEKNPPVVPLPYRMIFAVATKSSVYFYDTQQKQPFALISNIHYTRLTDVTWSNDGRVVVVSSTDGFCSLITFEEGELGEVYKDSDAVLEAALAQVVSKNVKTKRVKDSDGRSRKPSMDENSQSKEISTSIAKEPVLEKIDEGDKAEKDSKQNTDTTTTNEIMEENTPAKEATPIAIKRNPTSEESSEVTIEKETIEKSTNENTIETYTKKATPIAIKRKPGSTSTESTEAKTEKDTTEKNKKDATPIAIKRKPSSESNSDKNGKSQATPIAIKRKPGPVETPGEKSGKNIKSQEATPIAIKRKPGPVDKTDQKQPTPIAIKRKPGPIETNPPESENKALEASSNSEERTPPKVTKPVIILDKEILGSDEKFESPEKKSRPATPISVRRHPRTPSTHQTPTTQSSQSPTTFAKTINPNAEHSTSSSQQKLIKTPLREKKVMPIAVRKTPRNSIAKISEVNTPTLVEEAMDAWPLNKDEPETTSETTSPKKMSLKESGVTPLSSEDISDRTEDIRLVYEETVEEPPTPKKETKISSEDRETKSEINAEYPPKPETPANKTPRRVALKTISTPKSKKKLLD